MAEILVLGISHYPPLTGQDDRMAGILKRMLQNPQLPPQLRTPDGWPAEMRAEWSNDQGTASASRHRAELVGWMEKTRAALDDFNPDFVLIWGDDQYENFREDIIPPYSIAAYENFAFSPPAGNVWGETSKKYELAGNRQAAKMLTTRLIEAGFDTAYAYKPLHHPLGHAFANAVLYLDYARKGFGYPILPFAVNCYGRKVIAQRGGMPTFDKVIADADLDPPAPTPWRLFDLGAATAKILADSPYLRLVARVSRRKEPLSVSRHAGRPGNVRPSVFRQLRGVAQLLGAGGRRQRSAGDPELDVPRGRAKCARSPAEGDRLRRHLDLQFLEDLPDRPARVNQS